MVGVGVAATMTTTCRHRQWQQWWRQALGASWEWRWQRRSAKGWQRETSWRQCWRQHWRLAKTALGHHGATRAGGGRRNESRQSKEGVTATIVAACGYHYKSGQWEADGMTRAVRVRMGLQWWQQRQCCHGDSGWRTMQRVRRWGGGQCNKSGWLRQWQATRLGGEFCNKSRWQMMGGEWQEADDNGRRQKKRQGGGRIDA